MVSPSPRRRALGFALLTGTVALTVGLLLVDWLVPAGLARVVLLPAKVLLGALVVGLALWLVSGLLQRLLWRVGRRLAFSYLLIGVLPIPMLALIAGLNTYLLSGYFLGHLYRDEVARLDAELGAAAAVALAAGEGAADEAAERLATYRDGRRVAGSAQAPARWPGWLEGPGEAVRYVKLADGSITLAAVAGGAGYGVLALGPAELAATLTRRSGIWVELLPAGDPRAESMVRLRLGGSEFTLQPFGARRGSEARAAFFGGEEPAGLLDRPILWWGEAGWSLRALDGGATESERVAVSLNGNLRTLSRSLASSSGEVDTAVWAGLVGLSGLLATVYALAVAMALWIITGLSRAVNRLSGATAAVRRGDFSARLRSRRRDQIGELEHSFDEMAANLERLVDSAARQEVVHKELAIARDLQQSLLPTDLPATEAMEFSTLFEPSAAIGGDYFDVLRVDEERLAVVIADVSGHGLPTGLRMAMLKAALVILVEERKPAEEILRRLNEMVRAEQKQRFFVTATIAVVDFERHTVQITNAAHPPTYLLRGGRVEEILLPGSPLGALGSEYGRRDLELAPGDALVWLSDGLIEAADPRGEPFGYRRTEVALAGPATSALEVRNRLLAAVREHGAGEPADDDRTLVVMRYRPPGGEA